MPVSSRAIRSRTSAGELSGIGPPSGPPCSRGWTALPKPRSAASLNALRKTSSDTPFEAPASRFRRAIVSLREATPRISSLNSFGGRPALGAPFGGPLPRRESLPGSNGLPRARAADFLADFLADNRYAPRRDAAAGDVVGPHDFRRHADFAAAPGDVALADVIAPACPIRPADDGHDDGAAARGKLRCADLAAEGEQLGQRWRHAAPRAI